jgi:hypothetical protein
MFIAPSDGAFFLNSVRGDMLMRTQRATDAILIGTHSNIDAAVTITSNAIVFDTGSVTYKAANVCYHGSVGLRDVVITTPDAAEAAVSLATLHPVVVDGDDAERAAKVYGTGRGPSRHPRWRGWRYENESSPGAVAWYFAANPAPTDGGFASRRLDTFYVRLRVARGKPLPFVAVYTHPVACGSWFGARRHYCAPPLPPVHSDDGMDGDEADVVLYVGREPAEAGFLSLAPELTVRLQEDPVARIGEDDGEGTVHLIALATDPAAPPGSLDFVVTEAGYRFGGRVQRVATYL